ncbi:MAG: galactose-1-phosphate uridylyltransferase, partial [Oscillospiraceae bacterium]|nr:galactose-1-phosphate uridylyltransferase [Oscillospiraceae bacterium]
MGLAVLPARLERELAAVKEVLLSGGDLSASEDTGKHADWAKKIAADHSLNEENIIEVFHKEIGKVFVTVLEQCGVYRRDRQGKTAFLRFLQSAGGKC